MKKTEKKIMLITLIFVGIILAMLIAPKDALASETKQMKVGEIFNTGHNCGLQLVEQTSENVVEIYSQGGNDYIKAKGYGTAKIYCTVKRDIEWVINVKSECKSIELYDNEIEMIEGEALDTSSILKSIDPSDMKEKIVWHCSSDNLVFKTKKTGIEMEAQNATEKSVKIWATCEGKESNKVNVTVKPLIELNYTELAMAESTEVQLEATLAKKVPITWSSSDKNILTVDENGLVKAKSLDKDENKEVEIIAKVYNNNKAYTAKCKILVYPHCNTIKMNKTGVSMYIGDTVSIKVTTDPKGKNITWTVNESYVKKEENKNEIKITGKHEGTFKLKASYGGKSKTCFVEVKSKCKSITVNPATLKLTVGENKTIQASMVGKGDINWSLNSKNKDISKVNNGISIQDKKGEKCTITAKKAGTYYVYAWCEDKESMCKVIVEEKCKSIKIDKSSISLKKGYSQTLRVITTPEKDNITWSSSNNKIVTVEKGKVTGIKVGIATVYAECDGKKAKCIVNVTNLTTNINISTASNAKYQLKDGVVNMLVSGSTKLIATTNPSGKKVTWSSSNSNVATIDKNGNVKAKSNGITLMTAKYSIYQASCLVKVYSSNFSFEVSPTSFNLPIDSTYTLSTKLSDSSLPICWSSEDASIATVDQNGKVTPKKVGTVKINAKCLDKTVSSTITVLPLITMNPDNDDSMQKTDGVYYLEMYTGDIIKIFEKNSYNLYQNLELEYDNTIINITEETGVLEALKEGSTTVTIKCGRIQSETVTVTVKRKYNCGSYSNRCYNEFLSNCNSWATKAKYVYDQLIENGVTKAGAAGVLGNITQECRWDIQLAGVSQYGTQYGICQWGGDRLTDLKKRLFYNTLKVQTEFMISELQTKYYIGVWEVLTTAEDVISASEYFREKYEVVGDANQRNEFAIDWYNYFNKVNI